MRHEASLLKDILAAIGKIEGITAATPEESFQVFPWMYRGHSQFS